ncbi:hypothetical protein LV89_01987 [Arcicella aurantiaca]|uniref:Uncharacterized protein n=1 Tax=Arcicella aurantiaca TaxID=591202 RepID=A0A316EAL4_9BACT|nr:hypothetical protein [Arcicella aurantiaca]PWK27172.1 hypothetical protein LV89_01987 [Arcicella aurantiaca]
MTAEIHEIFKEEAKKIVGAIVRRENHFVKNTVFPSLFGRVPTRSEIRKIKKFPSAQNPNNTHIQYEGNWLGTLTPQVVNEVLTFVFFPTPTANQVILKGRGTGKKFGVTNLTEMAKETAHEN